MHCALLDHIVVFLTCHSLGYLDVSQTPFTREIGRADNKYSYLKWCHKPKIDMYLLLQIYSVVRKEIWYRPDMYFYRDMLYMLARNKKIEETRQVWADLKSEDVLFDQHTYGDIVRAFCDAGLIDLAMEFYEDMRSSPDPPLSLPFRVILKGLVPYPDLREKIKQDFLELFPDMIVYDPPDSLSDMDDEFKF